MMPFCKSTVLPPAETNSRDQSARSRGGKLLLFHLAINASCVFFSPVQKYKKIPISAVYDAGSNSKQSELHIDLTAKILLFQADRLDNSIPSIADYTRVGK